MTYENLIGMDPFWSGFTSCSAIPWSGLPVRGEDGWSD